MLKIIKIFSLLSFSILLLFSCSDSQVLPTYTPSLNGHYIIMEKNSFAFPSQGGTQTTQIRSNQSPWKFYDNPDWVSITPVQGQSSSNVSLSVSENLSADTTRMAIFYLNSLDENWSFQSYVSLTQSASSPFLELSTSSVGFSGSESTATISFETNTIFNTQCTEDWISYEVSNEDKIIEIKVEENLTGLSRTGNIILSGALNRNINVTQEAANLTGEMTSLTFSCDGGQSEIKFNSETSWEAETSTDWINISPEKGTAEDNTLVVTALANTSVSERTGYVYLKIGKDVKLQIKVEQEGIYIRTIEDTLNFPHYESTDIIHVESNTEWEVVSGPDWITCTPLSGRGDGEISLIANENRTVSSRSGKIVIGQKNYTYNTEVIVEQVGLTIDKEDTVQFDDKPSSQYLSLEFTGSWRINSADSWVSINPISGVGPSQIEISVEENNSNEERISTIEIISSNSIKIIRVIQYGKYFTFGQQTFEIKSTGGIVNFSFETNDRWEIINNDNKDWITLSKESGSGSESVDITIEDNPSIETRTAQLEVKPENNTPALLTIRQAGKYLNVDCTSLEFFAKGGTSQVININTDGEYEIYSDKDWVLLNQFDNSFSVNVSQNPSLDPRFANIVISLIGLKDSEQLSINIEIVQKGSNYIIGGDDYSDDDDWNLN